MDSLDPHYHHLGYKHLCGVDEAGRGPWAGPVFTAAVILPKNHGIRGLDDSKKLSPGNREVLFEEIIKTASAYSIVALSNARIDKTDILRTTKQGMQKAVKRLSIKPDFLLLDAVTINISEIPQISLVKGDGRSESIAAASILAKVSRDLYMVKMHRKYPQYNFTQNKGYGTKEHHDALKKYGPCPLHRMSFAPVKETFSS